METKVGIIVTVYNSQDHIARCLDSLINQTLQDIEVIIVDAGSVDDTEYIIKKYVGENPNKIKYFKTEDVGKANARNKAIEKVTSPFFMFVDSDDYLEGEACETLYKEALKSNYDIVTCDAYYYYLATEHKQEINSVSGFENLSDEKRYVISNYKPWGKLFNTKFWKENSFKFSESIMYDDLALIPSIIAYARKVKHVNLPLYNYLQHSAVMLNQETVIQKIKDIFTALAVLESVFLKTGKKEEYKDEIEYLYIKHLVYNAGTIYIKYEDYDEVDKIVNLIKRKFPNFRGNIYYIQRNKIFRKVCKLIYKRRYIRVKKMLKI